MTNGMNCEEAFGDKIDALRQARHRICEFTKLAVDPEAVRLELAEPGCTEPLDALLPRLRAEGVRPVSSNGVLGDPEGASADEGHRLLRALAEESEAL